MWKSQQNKLGIINVVCGDPNHLTLQLFLFFSGIVDDVYLVQGLMGLAYYQPYM
jgi:hypothetical protein